LLRDEVAVGMAEHETRLREQLALADAGRPPQPALTQGG
jgi:hypothetical protein